MNPNLPRWLFSSLAKEFKTVADSLNLPYHVEGVDEDEFFKFSNDSVLFRMTGPVAFTGTAAEDDEWYSVELQILLTDLMNLKTDNAYDVLDWAGVFQARMLEALQITRTGNGPEDDGTLIGCLQPDPTLRNNIRTVNYGVLDREDRVRQFSVNGKFILCL